MKDQDHEETGNIKRHKYHKWAQGIVIGNKLKFHPYTEIDFKFDNKRK